MVGMAFGPPRQIKSVSDVVEILKGYPEEHDIRLPKPRFIFRGQSDVNYRLKPSIDRAGFSIAIEGRLVEMAKNKRPDTFETGNKLTLLAKMQHYGLPTRLIDFTTNPLVALYFACQREDKGTDGEIIVFEDYVSKNGKTIPPFDSLMFPEPLKIGDETYQSLCSFISSNYYTHDFLRELTLSLVGAIPSDGLPIEIWRTRIVGQPWYNEWEIATNAKALDEHQQCQVLAALLKNSVTVEAQETLERQRIQQGLYLLIPNDVEQDDDEKFIIKQSLPTLYTQKANIGHMIIEAQDKRQLLKELDKIGINEGSLFGDSIDHICSQIKKSVKEDLPIS